MSTMRFHKSILSWLALFLPAAAILAGANALISAARLPLYGTFTGLRPLEEKLETYRNITREGRANAILLGSSLTESGCAVTEINAHLEKHGDKRRFFNLAEGGAHLQTQLTVYRMARLIYRPKEIVVGVLVIGTDSDYYMDSGELPMQAMKRAPVGSSLRSDWRLHLAFEAWRLPVLRDAAPLRDLLLHGSFVNRRFDYTDHHGRNEMGDLVSHAVCLDPEDARLQAEQQRLRLLSMWNSAGSPRQFLQTEWPMRLALLRKLKAVADTDGARLSLYPVFTAYMAVHEDREILHVSNSIIKALAAELDCKAITYPKVSPLRPYEMLDAAHFNRAGARTTGARLAAALTKTLPPQQTPVDFPQPSSYPSHRDPAWSSFPTTISHPKSAGELLEIEFKQGWNIPTLKEDTPLALMACLPSGDKVRLPTRSCAPAVIQVSLHKHLPLERDAVLLVSPVDARTGISLGIPIQNYRWLSSPVGGGDGAAAE